jgi:hypothetical protein
MATTWSVASDQIVSDGYSGIPIKEAGVQGAPKGSTIQAYINGHYLTVVFTENLGQVVMEIASTTGGVLQTYWANTPEGLQAYLPLTGNYVITFTLPNGDEYYGEFTVTD